MHPRRGGGPPAARRYLNYTGVYKGTSTLGPPSTIYVRAQTDQVDTVQSLLAQTANPESPNEGRGSEPPEAPRPSRARPGRHRSIAPRPNGESGIAQRGDGEPALGCAYRAGGGQER